MIHFNFLTAQFYKADGIIVTINSDFIEWSAPFLTSAITVGSSESLNRPGRTLIIYPINSDIIDETLTEEKSEKKSDVFGIVVIILIVTLIAAFIAGFLE